MTALRKTITQLLAAAAILTPLALSVSSITPAHTPQASDWPSGGSWSQGS
ncbi:hypothetical protein OHA70_07480 [Kribbella sp. NBC_00382]